MAESDVMDRKSNGQQRSDLPPLDRRIGFIQRSIFKLIHTLYNGIDTDVDIGMDT